MVQPRDLFAFSARISLLLQLCTVYPLVLLIIRTQVFGLLFRTTWPNIWYILLLNAVVMSITTCFAIYYPNVGDILRFTGAIGGFVLIFLVPIGIHLRMQKIKRTLGFKSWLLHGVLVVIGMVMLVLQFIHVQ